MILRQLCALCAWTTLVVAQQPTQEYVLSLTDQSPTIGYDPLIWGNGTASWNVSYSESPWAIWPPTPENPLGQGTSVHWTNTSGAVISFAWVGTGFKAYGFTAGNTTIQVVIDGHTVSNSPAPDNDFVLATVTDLGYAWHQVELTLLGKGGVEFYGVDLSLLAGDFGTTSTGLLNDAFIWSGGDWSPNVTDVDTIHSVPGDVALTTAWSDRINASVSFSPPSNTSILLIYGAIDPYTAVYSVNLNSNVYDGTQLSYLNQTTMPSISFQPVTPWAENHQILYYATLIPGNAYAVTLELRAGGLNHPNMIDFDLLSVVFISSSSYTGTVTSTSITASPTAIGTGGGGGGAHLPYSVGAIAGGILGGIAAALLIAGLCWFYNRRRRRVGGAHMYLTPPASAKNSTPNKITAEGEKDFDVDGYVETSQELLPEVQPFAADGHPRAPPNGATASPYEAKRSLAGSAPPQVALGATPTASPQTGATPSTPTPHISDGLTASSQIASPTRGQMLEGLDPSDPNYLRKWEILHSLDAERAGSTLPSSQAASTPSRTASTRMRDVDAGRIEGGEDMLPPDYNIAWAPRRQE